MIISQFRRQGGYYSRLLTNLFICVACVYAMPALAQFVSSENSVCQVNGSDIIVDNHALAVNVKQGSNTLNFDCNIESKSVLTLPAIGIHSLIVNINNVTSPSAILSAKKSYAIPPGKQFISLELISEEAREIKIQLNDFGQFHANSMSHNSIMSLYIGICLALALYVGLLGRGIKNTGFYAYSAYLVSLAIFFGIQEGTFNYFSHDLQFLNTRASQSIFAGIVVFAATLFISRLLDFKLLLNKAFHKLVIGVAIGVLIMGVTLTITPQNISASLSTLMGWSTLLLVFAIFCIAGYAAINRVHTANLIVIGLSTVLFGMIFRIWLTDLSEFLHRYALVIGTVIESFIFAFAASEKVRYLEQEKSRAYHSATQDDLCSVMNRRGWTNAVKRKLDYYRKRDGVVLLQFVNLKDFNSINDNYGHGVGDRVLQTIAKIIRHQAREDDVVGRFGGDKFVVFSYALSESQAQRINQRLQQKLKDIKLSIEDNVIQLSANVGSINVATESAELDKMLSSTDHHTENKTRSFQT